MKNSVQHQLNRRIEYGVPHPPYNEEHSFYDMVANGDVSAIEELKKTYGNAEISNSPTEKGILSNNPLRNAVYHLIVNCTIITRRCIGAGMPEEDAYTLSDLFIRRADLCKTVKETEQLNDEMGMEFAVRMKRLRENPAVSPVVRKAMNIISDRIGEKLTVEKIAAEIGYNRSYLSKSFKSETGKSVTEYILLKRIETAVSMIENDLPLSEVAEALGFASQSHFCLGFKRVMGVTPAKYKAVK